MATLRPITNESTSNKLDPKFVDLESFLPNIPLKKDGRLFINHALYCEGAPRPYSRGMIHLFCAILLPFGLWHLIIEANNSRIGQLAAALYILSNLICYGFSALYHVGRWSIQTEILIQKIDHSGIAILSLGTMIPTSILLLPASFGIPYLIITFIFALWTCISIFQLQPSVFKQILTAGTVVPFLPFFYFYMNQIEWYGTLATIVFQSIGLIIFMKHKPVLFPKYFGYHELFHLFVVFAGISVYIINWSIIRRTCNPYSLHTNIIDEWYHFLGYEWEHV